MRWVRLSGTLLQLLLRFAFGAATAAVVVWWLTAIENLADNAPRFSALKAASIELPSGSDIILGRAELLQPAGASSAELRHLRLRATDDGRLLISRVAELRGLNLEYGGKTEEGSSERYEIVRGPEAVTHIAAGLQRVELRSPQDGVVTFAVQDEQGRMVESVVSDAGTRMSVNGSTAPACFDEGPLRTAFAHINRATDHFVGAVLERADEIGLGGYYERRGKRTLAILGGEANCAFSGYGLVAMPLADPGIEFVIRQNLSDGRIFISSFRGERLAPVSYETRDGSLLLHHQYGVTGLETQVAGNTDDDQALVTHFTAGKSRYSIAAALTDNVWRIDILPSRRITLFEDDICTQSAVTDAGSVSVEDCPPPLDSSPNVLAQDVTLEVVKTQLPGALERLFVSSSEGLSSAEILARTVAIAVPMLIVLAVPGVTLWRANGGPLRMIVLAVAAIFVLTLALLPEIAPFFDPIAGLPNTAQLLLYGLGALWLCATLVVLLDKSGGLNLAILWFVLTAIIALGSVSLFSMSAEGPNTDWERFFIKHKLFVLDILPLFVIALTVVSPTALKLRVGNDFAGRPSAASPIFWLLATVLALFMAWFLLGNQTGLGGSIQPVEAGKFAIVVLLGATLAQWLIRARLMAQAWFGITLIALLLSALFIAALLFVPAVKSDYSPLVIILAVTAVTGLIGAMAVGWRIREEARDDLRDITRIPFKTTLSIHDDRLKPGQLMVVMIALAGIVLSPLAAQAKPLHLFETVSGSLAYSGAAALVVVVLAMSLLSMLRVQRAVLIFCFSIPIALLGAWALQRQDLTVLAIAVLYLAVVIFAISVPNRINWSLARLAIVAPIIALGVAILLRDLPLKAGLGIEDWSWFDDREKQISELEQVLGEGRRLPVERLLSWADLRYQDPAGAEEATQLMLRDVNFHVLRSRATLASAPCGISPELTAAPYGIAEAIKFSTDGLLRVLGIGCESEAAAKVETPLCTPSTLKGAVRPHCVPVVQSDFAATYITVRLGKGAAALLIILQAIFVFLVVRLYLVLQAKRSRDPVETGADQALAGISLGVGILFLMQWILAWSNAFGILPVMGQPMTWLSAGTSHHLFMAIPAALALIVAARLAGMKAPVLTIRTPPRPGG